MSPTNRAEIVPLFAFAWEGMVQLAYVDETNGNMILDGIYYSDYSVSGLFFIGDSTLLVYFNEPNEIKILKTTKFVADKYTNLLILENSPSKR